MTQAVHICGTILRELVFDKYPQRRQTSFENLAYYCPYCNKILTSDKDMSLGLISMSDDAKIEIEYRNLSYDDGYTFEGEGDD